MSGPRLSNAAQGFAASATVRMNAIKANATIGQWVGSVLAGIACVALGIALTKVFPAQWYLGAVTIGFGLNVASRGAFLHFILAIKDGVLALRGTPEAPHQSEDAQP